MLSLVERLDGGASGGSKTLYKQARFVVRGVSFVWF